MAHVLIFLFYFLLLAVDFYFFFLAKRKNCYLVTVPVLVAVVVCLSNQLAVGDCFFCCEFHTVNVCYLLLMIMVVGLLVGRCGVVLSGGGGGINLGACSKFYAFLRQRLPKQLMVMMKMLMVNILRML